MAIENPLLLTLSLDAEAKLYFNKLRKKYFPAERNFLDAHLMLFHQIPAGEETIIENIASAASKFGPMDLQITQVVCIGRGVAYKVECAALMQLHKHLQQQWQHWLIPQDKQKLWPHITVQNKVEPAVAKQLSAELSASFSPFTACGTGLTLWEYLGGPWQFVQQFDFTGAAQ
ncbi:2'-5' RNA ligase family protein [Mucilaginibacter pedocola]|uniref:Phosphoesterase HXTX n=1 Tax=Mucilaginibacter pedocola TaxID=1792845 RepID=A0A1S9PM41_9SPHI|nr:2'-5' RNA ligase family protein [Mucilaginibacter pedocola]OOQ62036.1 hypothetical protein BC343_03005 [Mucilaginibacter pedocola]